MGYEVCNGTSGFPDGPTSLQPPASGQSWDTLRCYQLHGWLEAMDHNEFTDFPMKPAIFDGEFPPCLMTPEGRKMVEHE